jgi:hypothetical protein
MHILSLDDVVDVGGDRSISADPILFHLRDELSLGEVARGQSLIKDYENRVLLTFPSMILIAFIST